MAFRLRPGQHGIALRLHEFEAEIMDIVWSRKMHRFSVGDVLSVLVKRRDVAYTTVMTTVARLYDKGLLSRERDGKRYLYSPLGNREEFLQATAREVFESLGASAGRESLAMLVETVSSSDTSALDELELLIRLRRKELGS